ncbi:ABC transporter permease [Candidatus Bathyarchaeota archaeon]|nr:ABC transporter permease [Candidatus Bathyarchaeota archaeon]MBS7617644.1 ABC transporter permease [Candidatus Bathyarchaeota archaeon]
MNPYMILDFIRLSLKALSERRARALLTTVGISIGPLVLVMMSSVVGGYSDYIVERVTSLGQNAIAIFPNENYKISDEDLRFVRSIPEVARAEPFYSTQGTLKRGTEEIRVSIFAIDYTLLFEAIGSLKISEGKIPSETELLYSIVGRKIAFKDSGEQYFTLDDVLTVDVPKIDGGKITGKKSLNVILGAILEEYGGALIVDPDSTIFLSPEAGRRLLGMRDWSGIFVLAKDPSFVKAIVSTLRSKYEDRLQVIAFSAIAETISSITGAINFINFSTSLSAFAVAVAGTAATMITAVMERTREIGVMKAIGYTNSQILFMILLESIMMSLVGGLVGISLGAFGAHILSSRGFSIRGMGLTFVVSPKITSNLIVQTILLTITVGLVGGALPAYRASKIPPVVALRYE